MGISGSKLLKMYTNSLKTTSWHTKMTNTQKNNHGGIFIVTKLFRVPLLLAKLFSAAQRYMSRSLRRVWYDVIIMQ